MFIFDKENIDYSQISTQNLIEQFTAKYEENRCFKLPELTESWIRDYLEFLETELFQITSNAHFNQVLKDDFLATSAGSAFAGDVWFNEDGSILSSRIWLFVNSFLFPFFAFYFSYLKKNRRKASERVAGSLPIA